MNCPACGNPMLTFELKGIEVDYSPECGGIWLDAGELEALLGGGPGVLALIESLTPAVETVEKPRKCPLCRRKMEKVYASGEQVLLDRCIGGEGLFFDGGELEQLLRGPGLDATGKVQGLLAEMFSPSAVTGGDIL